MAKNGLLKAVRRICGALALCALAGSFVAVSDPAGAAEGRKRALVIGNDAYENQPALAKAVGDAHAMRATLEKLGFEVRLAENLNYAGMVGALANFQSSIDPGDTVALHFSGHGVAANGRNYLLPVDFPQPESGRQGEVLLPRLAFDAGEIVDGLRSQGAALTLAVFDACRDNALTSGTRSIGMSRGLVRMDPPRGVFIMFSAGPGELAADRLSDEDAAATSVFTRVFIPILETPGLTLVEVAKRTQVRVSELAATVDHQQFPDYSDRVIGDVVLVPKAEPEPPIAPPTATTETEVAAVAPKTTPQSSTPPLSSKVVPPASSPADADVSLCDSVAGDPYDPSLPASVDRSKLYDLERIVDEAAARYALSSAPSYDPANPLVVPEMPGAMVACDLAMKKHPEERRLAYQRARAVCLSGRSDLCPDDLRALESLDHPSAAKFAAFARLSGIDDRNAAGGLGELLKPLLIDDWFGLPAGTPEEVPTARDLLAGAGANGDVEAAALVLLLDNQNNQDALLLLLTKSGRQGIPTALAASAVAVSGPTDLSEPMRTVLQEAADKGSHLAGIVLALSYRDTSTPEDLQKAKDVLAPAVAAGSPTAALILKQIETEELAARSPDTDAPTTEAIPPAETSSPVDPGDDKYKALAGREIWITASPNGKEIAARVEERLRSVGMSVTIFEGDPQYGWDHDLDYGPSNSETAPLVQALLSDLYPMDLVFAETRDIPNVTITPSPDSSATQPTSAPAAVAASDEKYKALAGRDIWIMVNPNGKEKAAIVEQRLREAGMNVLINEVDEYYDWDGDLDYEAKDAEIVSLVKELISDLYVMDLAITETRSIPNITITPSQ